jgi:hypothetical protein
MNETEIDPKWLTTGLALSSAILTFRVASALLDVFALQVSRIPYEFAKGAASYAPLMIPLVSVSCAVLVSALPERKLRGARRKTKVGVFVLLLVLALLPVEFKMNAIVQMPPMGLMERN